MVNQDLNAYEQWTAIPPPSGNDADRVIEQNLLRDSHEMKSYLNSSSAAILKQGDDAGSKMSSGVRGPSAAFDNIIEPEN